MIIGVTKEKAEVFYLFKRSGNAGLLCRLEELPDGQHIQMKWHFKFTDVIGNPSNLQYGDQVTFTWDKNAPVLPGKYPSARSVEKIVAPVAAVKLVENNEGGAR